MTQSSQGTAKNGYENMQAAYPSNNIISTNMDGPLQSSTQSIGLHNRRFCTDTTQMIKGESSNLSTAGCPRMTDYTEKK
jgi:hypothetical protein